MATKSQQPNDLSPMMNAAIEGLNLAEQFSNITPAKAVFSLVSALMTMIRDSMLNKRDYVEIGLSCADVCQALERGLNGRQLVDLSKSVLRAIEQLTTTVAEIQRKVVKRGKKNVVSRFLNAKGDKDAIATWKQDLNRILHVFNTELLMNNHTILLDIHRNVLASQEGTSSQHQAAQTSVFLGELPPPPPRVCFGRDDVIEEIIGLAQRLKPIALIGAGGIGKTSIALNVLHQDRIKERFRENRRFVRCDEIPPSRANFINRLSKVIGASVENPTDLTAIRPFLSSKEIFLVLDNAESVLDAQGGYGQEVYDVVEELSQFDNICLLITSRITTVPPDCETLEVPPLSMEAAHDTFYRVYKHDGRSDSIGGILQQLDFHPLSVTLLATVAQQNKWDNHRLAREWEKHQTSVLRTEHKNLAATVELSLASPMFRELGPDARELLGIIAFFPQGLNESNLDWLFPTILNRIAILDKFCVLSLTSRSNGCITMLAPLRDYLRPKDPKSSPLLLEVKRCYFTRMSVNSDARVRDARWVMSEDANVEHLLAVFTSIDPSSTDVWDACARFMKHLYWHKPRQTILKSRIEGLPDDHRSKPECLYDLSRLFHLIGNQTERKRLLNHALKLERGSGTRDRIARTLRGLSDANRRLGSLEEGIQQSKEAFEIFEGFDDPADQARSLNCLAQLLLDDEQFGAAEEAAVRAIALLPKKGQEAQLCKSHRVLGRIYYSKGERGKAIHQFEAAVRIASVFNWHDDLFWIHYYLASLFRNEKELENAQIHIELAKPHAVGLPYHQGRAADMQAGIFYDQKRLEEAKSEALRAIMIFEKLGVTKSVEISKKLLENIERGIALSKSRSGVVVASGPSALRRSFGAPKTNSSF